MKEEDKAKKDIPLEQPLTPPIASLIAPQENSASSTKSYKFLFICLFLLMIYILMGGGLYLYLNNKNVEQKVIQQQNEAAYLRSSQNAPSSMSIPKSTLLSSKLSLSPIPTATVTPPPIQYGPAIPDSALADWSVFTSSDKAFSIKYPSDFKHVVYSFTSNSVNDVPSGQHAGFYSPDTPIDSGTHTATTNGGLWLFVDPEYNSAINICSIAWKQSASMTLDSSLVPSNAPIPSGYIGQAAYPTTPTHDPTTLTIDIFIPEGSALYEAKKVIYRFTCENYSQIKTLRCADLLPKFVSSFHLN